MAETFPSEINGLSIAEIEKRAKPISDNTTDPENWRFRSFDGFLGLNETLEQVIRDDKKLLERLQMTNTQFANCLKRLLNEVNKIRVANNYTLMRPIHLDFEPTELISNNSNKSETKSQRLEITRVIFASPQSSLFWNEKSKNENEKQTWNTQWNEDFIIQNLKSDVLKFRIAGNEKCGIIDYVDRLSFFEGGGVRNQYRLDPRIVCTVLTGHLNEESLKLISDSEKSKNFDLENEMNESEKELNQLEQRKQNKETLSKRDEDFHAFLFDRIKSLKEQIKQKENEISEKIEKLKL